MDAAPDIAPGAHAASEPGYWGQAWLVIFLAVVSGATLAFVQMRLGDAVAANKLNETLTQVPRLVWGDAAPPAVDITPGTAAVTTGGNQRRYPVYRVTRDGELAGWVAKAGGQGYADRIEALVGLSPDGGTITGLFVLEQKETPGLGNKITLPDWRAQFAGKTTGAPLRVVKGGGAGPGEIDAVTGATISSRSVTDIVNRAVADLRPPLAAGAITLSTGETQ